MPTHSGRATLADADLLNAAITASGVGPSAFARDVLDIDLSTLTRWRQGTRRIDPTVRVICRAIVDDPGLSARLAAIVGEIHATP